MCIKNVFVFSAALTMFACKNEVTPSLEYKVDEVTSEVQWKGFAKDHFHVGTFAVNGQFKTDKDGNIVGGDFHIPIASIENLDLRDPEKKVLLDDLKSANFFNLIKYPEATFHVVKVEPYSGADTAAIEGANYLLSGDFTMLGQTHALSFPFKVGHEGKGLSAMAKFTLDRGKWGMNIYSDSTKPLYIYPGVDILLNIKSNR